MDSLVKNDEMVTGFVIDTSNGTFRIGYLFEFELEIICSKAAEKLRVQIFCLAWYSNSLTTFPQRLDKGLGMMQMFAKSPFKSYIFFLKQGSTILYYFQMAGALMNFP